MQETLHLSSTFPTTSKHHHHQTLLPSPSRPPTNKHLHLPSPPSPPPPPITLPSTATSTKPPIISPSSTTQFQENLLYLDSLGIDPFHCLSNHPLIFSTPLTTLKSIISFLYSLGLTTPNIRRVIQMCPDILTTPLNATLLPATTFLLREAGVEGSSLRHVIHRRPRLLTKDVSTQLRPTLYFLQSAIGISDLSRHTFLLSCSVESKFLPRMEYLQKLGFSEKDTIVMFRRFPSLFCYSIKENLEPKFNYFVVEMGRELRELVDFPQYFSFSLENRIKPRHKMCVEKGVCLPLAVMLRSSPRRFKDRLEVCCSSSMPVRNSPLYCTNSRCDDINVKHY